MHRFTPAAVWLGLGLASTFAQEVQPAETRQDSTPQVEQSAPTASATGESTGGSEDPKPFTAHKPEWVFQFDPNAWYAGVSGKVRIAGTPTASGPTKINDMNVDQPRLTPAGMLSVRTGKWRFGLGTFFFNQDRLQTMTVGGQEGNVTFAPGQQLYSKVTWDEYQPVAAYEIWRRDPEPQDAVKFLPRLELFGGARLDDLKFSFSQGALSDSQSQFFGQAIVGINATMDIAEQFSIDFETSGGGWPGGDQYSYSWDIAVAFKWRPITNVGVLVGYRNMTSNFQDGKDANAFSYRGGIAGIFFGATIRF